MSLSSAMEKTPSLCHKLETERKGTGTPTLLQLVSRPCSPSNILHNFRRLCLIPDTAAND